MLLKVLKHIDSLHLLIIITSKLQLDSAFSVSRILNIKYTYDCYLFSGTSSDNPEKEQDTCMDTSQESIDQIYLAEMQKLQFGKTLFLLYLRNCEFSFYANNLYQKYSVFLKH